jgi:hypothetical protein
MTLTFAATIRALCRAETRLARRTRIRTIATLIRGNCLPDPERLRSDRPRFRNRGRFARVHSTFARPLLTPFSPGAVEPFLFKRRSCRVVLPGPRRRSALRLRSHGDREDASHRLLQPTDDTSTREPSDSRLEALASRNRAVCWTPRWRRDRLSASRLRVKARSTTRLQLRPYRSSLVPGTRPALGRRLRRGVFDRVRSG